MMVPGKESGLTKVVEGNGIVEYRWVDIENEKCDIVIPKHKQFGLMTYHYQSVINDLQLV